MPDMLEIPAGKLDVEGEDPLDAAKRELAEEIGKQAAHWDVARRVLHLTGLRRRDHPPVPRHRHLRRRRAPRGRGERAHRRRGPPARRARRDPRRDQDSKTLIALYRLKDRLAHLSGPARRAARTAVAPRRTVLCAGRESHADAEGGQRWPSSTLVLSRPRPAEPFEHLVLDFLAYLEFERGLSRNTLEAYRSDLLQYGAYLNGRDALAVTHSDLAGLRLLAGRRRRREAAGGAGDAAAQGRLPALVPSPPAPPRHPRGRSDRATCARPSRAGGCRRCSRATRWPSCSSSRAAPSRPRCATARCWS